jgi:hypothetical protein
LGSVKQQRRPSRRAYLLITAFALLLVIFPFLFWYNTWFGRKLTDSQIERYLNDPAKARHAQHALVQLGERMSRGGRRLQRWYPKVIELSRSPVVELRQTAAWIMGQDSTYVPFHAALLDLLRDPLPMVRRNAALSLVGFGDSACRPELLAMLRPHTIASPAMGVIKYRLKTDNFVNPGTLVGRVGDVEVRSPLPGEVSILRAPDGSHVNCGDPLIEISPDRDHAWEALRALFVVGKMQDLEDVQRYVRGFPGMPDRLQQQASLTTKAIQDRDR